MTAEPPAKPSPPPRSAIYQAAVNVLVAFACAQVLAVGWVFASRVELAPRQQQSPVLTEKLTTTAAAPQVAAVQEDWESAERELLATLPRTGDPFPPSFVEATIPPLNPMPAYDPVAITEPSSAAAVARGIEARDEGDMRAALESFREALAYLPAHPRVLYEIATTYETMSLADRATPLWEQIYQMGADAGEIHAIADSRLRGATTLRPMLVPDSLTIGSVSAERDPSIQTGEQVLLKIPLLTEAGTAISANEVELHVLFFDLVDGTQIAQTTADPPSTRWASGPDIDWQGVPEEVLEVTYHQPYTTGTSERRNFYGYLIKLYYQGQLMDQLAEPRTLFDFISPAEPTSEPDPSLFPDF